MFRFAHLIGILVMGACLVPSLPAEPPEEKSAEPVKPLMRLKLERAKSILEGLTLEDYDMIAKNARGLKLLSLESGWNVYQTERYMAQSRDFRDNAELIAEAAKDKDLNRAALGYVALTVRCVECHNYMRKNKVKLMSFQPAP